MAKVDQSFVDDGRPMGWAANWAKGLSKPEVISNLPKSSYVRELPSTHPIKVKLARASASAGSLINAYNVVNQRNRVVRTVASDKDIEKWKDYFLECDLLTAGDARKWTFGKQVEKIVLKGRRKQKVAAKKIVSSIAKDKGKPSKTQPKVQPKKSKDIKLVEPEGPACGAQDGVACFIDAYVTVYDTIVRRMKRVAKSKGEDASDVMDRMQDVMPYLHQSSNQVSFSGENYAVSKEVESGYAGSAQALMAAIFGELLDLREYRRARVAAYYGETTSDEIRQIIDKSTKEYLGMVLTQNGLKKLEKKIAEKLPRKPDAAQELDAGTSNPNPTTRVVESKSYNIDFSKWKPMIKNSY